MSRDDKLNWNETHAALGCSIIKKIPTGCMKPNNLKMIPGFEVIKLFSCSTILSIKFIVPIMLKCQQVIVIPWVVRLYVEIIHEL